MKDNRSLDKIVKIGTCEAGMCNGQALAEISLDTLKFDPKTLEARAYPKSVKVCMKHKSWYFKYQDTMLDKINPERKKHGKEKQQSRRQTSNMANSSPIARRFQ